jgi:lipopolysaccharide assembly protein A
MKNLNRLLKWTLKAAIFFALFAFALNNQQDATVYFFLGTQWTAPMVLILLVFFAAGLLAGVLAMVPRWWKQRSAAGRARRYTDRPQSDNPSTASLP